MTVFERLTIFFKFDNFYETSRIFSQSSNIFCKNLTVLLKGWKFPSNLTILYKFDNFSQEFGFLIAFIHSFNIWQFTQKFDIFLKFDNFPGNSTIFQKIRQFFLKVLNFVQNFYNLEKFLVKFSISSELCSIF